MDSIKPDYYKGEDRKDLVSTGDLIGGADER